MLILTAAVAAAQSAAMTFDEFYFHRRRGLTLVESAGHVADSLAFLTPLLVAVLAPAQPMWRGVYIALSAVSCALITKDEWIHAARCEAEEHWIHSVLFVLHPWVLFGVGLLWVRGEGAVLRGLLPAAVALFAFYQAAYWIFGARFVSAPEPRVNNDFYGRLGELWNSGDGHAIALLRAETKERLSYVREALSRSGIGPGANVLDVGCGGGLISNALAGDGFALKGVDAAHGALETARAGIPAGAAVRYAVSDAYALQEAEESYDAVLLLDVLEHFEEPARAVAEAARVLRPGGILVVHTFNRSALGWLFAVKGLSLVVKDCPPNVHVYRLLVKPQELDAMAERSGLRRVDRRGIRPRILHAPFWWTLARRRVHPGFEFRRTDSIAAGYLAVYAKPKN
jgi:2-polyprenyl-6-hydroxyphenyl methylase/3-demethylubiquinone-9 3-methyltransferase